MVAEEEKQEGIKRGVGEKESVPSMRQYPVHPTDLLLKEVMSNILWGRRRDPLSKERL